MIKQGLFNDSILEKKFKILRTSLLLGNVQNREETLATYDETAREIDKIRRGLYEEKVAAKMYNTSTMEEEQKRLEELISIIEARVSERNEFIDDYIKVTSNYLDDLPKTKEEEELVDYKIRLDNIHEFLSNCDEILKLNHKLGELRDELEKKYENKANSEIINSKLEDELIEEYNRFITRDSYYASLNYTDIDGELAKIEEALSDKEDVMNTFISSYEALKNAGITGAEREEYLSYVKDSRIDYYNELEKKYILDIYKLVLDKENDYDRLYEKRVNIQNMLNDRANKRTELEVETRDDLVYFIDLCREQFSVIKSQKFNIEDIDKLIIDISDCENRLSVLEEANNRPEIVALVDEFNGEAPDALKIEMPNEEDIKQEEVAKDEDMVLPKADNMVVKVSTPTKLNVRAAADTAKLVMKKVVIVLEPKRFNNKRKEETIEENIEVKADEVPVEEVKDVTASKDGEFVQLDVNDDTSDISDNVFLDDVTTENTTDTTDGSNMPIEIFIDNTSEEASHQDYSMNDKPAELFSETDPFLDDNELTLDETNTTEAFVNGVPLVDNIGTVKPTSALSKIENVGAENSDIILPTMGLTNNDSSVPIVSENYIKESD